MNTEKTLNLSHAFLGAVVVLATACSQSPGAKGTGNNAAAGIVNGVPVENVDPIANSTVDLYYFAPNSAHAINFCSGTIIADNKILTAAHCFVDASKELGVSIDEMVAHVKVGFGTAIVDTESDTKVSFVQAQSVNVNKDYVMGRLAEAEKGEALYDMSVVTLAASIPQGSVVMRLLDRVDALQVGTKLTLAGFGLTSGGYFGTPATRLMKTDVTIENPALNPTQFRYQDVGGHSACSGDSGGPAYYTDADGSLLLAGVTSWGDGNCKQFGVYTSVPAMIDWIRSNLQ